MITLYHKFGSQIVKAAEQAIPGNIWVRVKRKAVLQTRDIPAKADLVLTVGKQTPPIKLEWWAANKGALLCCLPEADDYVGTRAADAHEAGQDLVLIDATLRKLVG